MNWHTFCCDLKSHWGGNTRAAPQPRIRLRADEINLCWSLARNEPLPNHIGWLPAVAPSTQRRVHEYKGRTRRAFTGKPGARLKSIESELMDDMVRVLTPFSAESIRVDAVEPLRLEKGVELGVPHFGGLLKPIQRLKKTAHRVWIRGIDVSPRLLHADFLGKAAVQEGRLDVRLM